MKYPKNTNKTFGNYLLAVNLIQSFVIIAINSLFIKPQ